MVGASGGSAAIGCPVLAKIFALNWAPREGLTFSKKAQTMLKKKHLLVQTSLKLGLSPKRDYTSLPHEIIIGLLRFT